jgi:hypothetical protein
VVYAQQTWQAKKAIANTVQVIHTIDFLYPQMASVFMVMITRLETASPRDIAKDLLAYRIMKWEACD